MNYEHFIKKSIQYHSNVYCVAKKSFLSFNFGLNHRFGTTDIISESNFHKSQTDSNWSSKFHISIVNFQHPRISLWVFPQRYFSIHVSSKNCTVKLNAIHPSITLNLSPDTLLNYSITANFFTDPSVIGSFNFKNKLLMSIRLRERKLSSAYNIKGGLFDMYCGLKMKNTDSILNIIYSAFNGIKIPLRNNRSISFAAGFLSDSLKNVIAFRGVHHRITSIFVNGPVYDGDNYSYKGIYNLQYKYVNNRGKIGSLYSFSSKNLFLRGSFKVTKKFVIKATVRLYINEDRFHINPGFEFFYQI